MNAHRDKKKKKASWSLISPDYSGKRFKRSMKSVENSAFLWQVQL